MSDENTRTIFCALDLYIFIRLLKIKTSAFKNKKTPYQWFPKPNKGRAFLNIVSWCNQEKISGWSDPISWIYGYLVEDIAKELIKSHQNE